MTRFAGERIWSQQLENLTGYREHDLIPAVTRIRKLHWEIGDSAYQNTVKKYGQEQRHRVSEWTPLPQKELRFDCGNIVGASGLSVSIPAVAAEVPTFLNGMVKTPSSLQQLQLQPQQPHLQQLPAVPNNKHSTQQQQQLMMHQQQLQIQQQLQQQRQMQQLQHQQQQQQLQQQQQQLRMQQLRLQQQQHQYRSQQQQELQPK
jgi:flagellar biosynthesis GTPase FlhF